MQSRLSNIINSTFKYSLNDHAHTHTQAIIIFLISTTASKFIQQHFLRNILNTR